MNAMASAEISAPRPLPKWLPPAGGLLAAGLTAFFVNHLPNVYTLSLREILGLAIENVLVVFFACATVMWLVYTIRPLPAGLVTRRLILQTSLDGLWLAPLALFVHENSEWATVIAAVFARKAAKTFQSLQDPYELVDREAPPLLTYPDGFRRPRLRPPGGRFRGQERHCV